MELNIDNTDLKYILKTLQEKKDSTPNRNIKIICFNIINKLKIKSPVSFELRQMKCKPFIGLSRDVNVRLGNIRQLKTEWWNEVEINMDVSSVRFKSETNKVLTIFLTKMTAMLQYDKKTETFKDSSLDDIQRLFEHN